MIYAEKLCRIPISCKRSGKYDVMLADLTRLLKPDESSLLWIQPNMEDVPYGHQTDNIWFDKPKEPHITIPSNVTLVYPVAFNKYRALKRSVEASIKRLSLPLKVSTVGKRPVITRLPSPNP